MTWLRTVAALALVAVSLTVSVVAPAPPAAAAVLRPFTPVFSQQTNGSIQITGNTVMTCGSSTTCSRVQNGTLAASNNNFTMSDLDVDSDAGTVRSSSADLTVPTGARVIYAGLFWGAARDAGRGGSSASGSAGAIKFRTPGASGYTTLTADRLDNQTSGNSDYSAYRDVTALVQGAGAGTYWGADIAAATGADRYAGWSLVVALSNPSAPLRDLTVFSGYATVTNNEVVDTTISGFLSPPSGTVDAKFGFVTYEGDNGITGDYFQVGSTRLADSLSPSANFFTSRISANGSNLGNRNPSSVNNLSQDAKVVDAPGVIANGATSADVRFATSGDWYYPAALTTQIDLYAPAIKGSKSVTNLSGNIPAKVGDVLEYSLTFSNTGDDAAINSVVSDALPPDTTYVPGSIRYTAGGGQGPKTDVSGDDQAEYDAVNRRIRARIGRDATATTGGALVASNTSTLTFQVRVDPEAAGSTLRNTASLAYRAQTIGRDYTYETAEVATPVADEADVSITKTASPNPVTAGNLVTYTLTTSNAGPSTAAGVRVVDTFPAGVSYVSSDPSTGSCSVAGGTLTCGLGSLPSSASATVQVVVRVPVDSDATSLTNVARVSTSTSDPNVANNNASATSTVVRQADLALSKSVAPASPVPGNDVTYTLVATNNGASRATAVRVTDTLPSSLTVRSATADRGTCTVTGSQVSCSVGSLDPGETVEVSVVATVPSNAGTAPLTNSASVASSTNDPTPGNNAASATVTPTPPRADLVVAKRAVTSPVVAGRAIQYVVTVANDGPSDATGVTLTDAVPDTISGVSATSTAGSCTVATNAVTCNVGDLAAGRSTQVTIDGQLDADATGTLDNSATASSPTTDPTPGNNTGTASVPVSTRADLALTKSASPVVDGNVATYTVVVTNNGPSVARSVTVTDPVPAPLTYVSSSSTRGTCTSSGTPTTVTCDVGDLPVGASATVTVRAQTPADGSGSGVSNTATAASPTSDPVPGNNSATYVLPTASQADLSLTKTATPDPVVAGRTVTWRLTAHNAGPSVAGDPGDPADTGVTITDTVPGRVTDVSATSPTPGASCATNGNDVSCTVPTLGPDADFEVLITGTVLPSAATGSLANSASVAAMTPTDPSPANNAASAATEVVASADLAVTKTGPATVTAGGTGEWVITVRNNGPSTATDVRLSDDVPAGTTLVSASSTPSGVECSIVDGAFTCPVGALAPGAQVAVTVVGRISSALPGGSTLVNSAAASSATPDPAPGNNSANHTATVVERSDVRIAKASDPVTLVPGAESTYLLTVTNDGPSDARDVVVTDTLDPDLTVLEATIPGGTCDTVGSEVTCRRAVLPVDASVVARIRVLVDAERQSPLTNTAIVTSASDTTPDNNTGSVTSTVVPTADLQIIKTASETEVAAGAGVTYSLTVVNNGPSLAAAATVSDTLPADIVPAAATSTDGTCTITDQQVECALGDVAPGSPVVVTVTASTGADAPPGTRTNEATVTSPTADDVPGNNSSQVSLDIVAQADVQVTKSAVGDSFVPGREVSWSIVFNNVGPSTARDVVVSDTVPAAVTILSAVHGTASPCAIDGRQVTCDLGDRAPGQRVVKIVGTLASGYTGATLANTVRATTSTPDPAQGNNSATATTPISRITDLEVVKTVSPADPVAGQRVTYTLSVYNNGPSDALNPQLIDQLPSGLTDVVINRPTLQGVPATAECELRPPTDPGTADNPTAPTVFCSGPVFRAGLPARVIGSIEATIAPGFTGSLTNTTRISSDTIDIDAANNESSVTSQVGARADVSITKSVSPATPVPGQEVTWAITARNDGPSTARDVVVTDDVADALTGLTATTGTTPNPCTVAAGNDVTCDLGDLAPGATVTITLAGGLPADFTADLDNTASIASPTDTTPANNSATATSTPRATADVSITKTVSPLRPIPGQDVTYTLVLTNQGPSTARAVTLRDDVPDAVTGLTATTGTSPNPCTVAAGNDVTCDLGDLAPGATVTVTIGGGLPAGFTGDLVNTATVESPTDATPGNNSATASGSTDPQADVSVSKALSPSTPVPGQDVTYTLVVTNNGPSTARDVTMDDDLADVLTDVTVSTGSTLDPCTIEAGNDVSCRLGDLVAGGPGSSVVITITGGLPAGFTGSLGNTAYVDSVTDSTPGNNSATANGTAEARADVSLTKALSPTTPVPGQDVTYTLVVANSGPSVARDVVVRDDVDDALTAFAATTGTTPNPCTVAAGNDVTCSLGNLAAGTTRTITLRGQLPAGFTGALDNTATVDSPTDTTPGNNTATAGGTAEARANVSITKALAPTSPIPGREVRWTVVVANTGPSVARDVVVRDDVDDALTAFAATTGTTPNPCTVAAGNDVTCDLGDLAPGATRTITLRGQLPSAFTGDLDNTATVDSPTDTTPGNNTATVTGTAAPDANVGITKTVSPSNPVPGNDVTWTLVVGNTGPSVARDVVVRDDVNDAITDLSATTGTTPNPCTVAAGNDVTCDLGDLAPGARVVITLSGGVPADLTGQLSNTATVSSPTDDTPDNNSATANPTTAPGADVSVLKTSSPRVPVPGQDITWTVTVTNAGPSVARDVVITDDVNDALTDVTASSPCTVDADNEVTCEVGDLGVDGADAVVTVTITGFVPSDYTGTLDNTATVASATDTTPGNNTSTTSGTADPRADVSITKTATPTAPVPGRDQTWTLTITNAGPSDATGVVVGDDVADQVSGLTAGTGGTPNPCTVQAGNDVTCTLGTLGAGDTVTVTITGGVPPGFTGALDNTATVASPTDTTPRNNTSSTSGTADPQADVSITKTATPLDPVPGRDATWTLVVSNAGPSLARDVVVTDDVLDAITGLTASSPCTIAAGNEVTCDLGNLDPGESRVLTLSGRLPAGYTGTVDNTASVASPTDITPGNNTSSTSGTADPQADVSITKTATPVDPVPGEDVRWTIGVTNSGPSVARDVVVTDDVLDAITGLTASSPCTIAAGNEVTCGPGDIAPASTWTIILTGRLPADYRGAVDNTATVASPTDTTPGNNSASTSGTATPTADVTVTKTLDPARPVPGEQVTWTVTVSNSGPSTAREVSLVDDVDDAVSGLAVTGDGSTCTVGAGNAVDCDLGDLAAGSSRVLTLRGALDAGFTGTLANTARVSSPTDTAPGNNLATVEGVAAPRADLSLTKTMSPSRPVAGRSVTFTMVVRNDGPSTARRVVVSDDLISALSGTTASMTDPGSCRIEGQQVACELAALAPGATATVTLEATVDEAYRGEVTNVATVEAETPDPDPSNNTARVGESGTGGCAPAGRTDGRVVVCADLGIDKTAAPRVAAPGDRITYTIEVTNDGPSAASRVRVVDELDDELTLVSVTVVQGKARVTTSGRSVTAVFATLRSGGRGVVRLVARLADDASGQVRNVAVASTGSPDVGDVEVQDEADVEVLADDGDAPGTGGGDSTDDADGGGVLPDTGMPASVVPLAALSLLLLASGLWLVRRSRVSGGRSPGRRG